MRCLDLFTGIGGMGRLLPCHPVMFCEIEPFPRRVLQRRIQSGDLPPVPIHDDVRTLNPPDHDILIGGFPCQDISIAGAPWLETGGIYAERSGLWFEYFRLICELRPRYAILENVPNLLAGDGGAWFGTILGNLASIGYDAEWHCIPASELGAHHHRDRVFVLSYPSEQGLQGGGEARDARGEGQERRHQLITRRHRVSWRDWETEPSVGRVVNGLPHRAHRIRGLGNAIVPQIATMIGRAIWDSSGS